MEKKGKENAKKGTKRKLTEEGIKGKGKLVIF